jgi:hypothetical protein
MGVTWCRTPFVQRNTSSPNRESLASPRWHKLPKVVPVSDQVRLTLSVTAPVTAAAALKHIRR